MAPFCGWDATASKLYKATMRRQFTFYQKFLVLIKSVSEGWKTEMTLKPSIGFELCINLVTTKYKLKSKYVKLTQLWPCTVNCFKVSSQSHLAGSPEGRSQTYLYAHSEKSCLIFQTANRVPRNNLLGSCKKFH